MTWQGLPLTLWQSIPFGDPDSFTDWQLQHWLHHIEIAKKTNTRLIPLDTMRDDSFAHALIHRDEASALSLPAELNFTDFDLNDQDSYYDFLLSHSDHHALLGSTAGL